MNTLDVDVFLEADGNFGFLVLRLLGHEDDNSIYTPHTRNRHKLKQAHPVTR